MKYRTLGKTNVNVSILGLGASPFGGVFGEVDEQECARTVFSAMDAGINFIDVSPYYGLTRAETVLGKAIHQVKRDNIVLATKVGRYGENDFDFSARRITQSVDDSLRRLHTDYVDLIQCHDIEFVNLQQIIEETLPALRQLQSSGKARFVGITGLPLKIFPTVMDFIDVDTVLSYCHYTLLHQSLSSFIPYLQNKNVGIINASPFSMGLLTTNGAPSWHPASNEIKQICAQATAYCSSHGIPIEKLALQYSLSNPNIHTTLVGAASVKHIRQNVQWMNEPLDQETLQVVLTICQPVNHTMWQSGLPENN